MSILDPTFRRALPADADEVWGIICDAKADMLARGSIQWGDNYPLRSTIDDDVAGGNAWVIECRRCVAAYGVVQCADEQAYSSIDGAWLTAGSRYAVVHRLAVASDCRGQGYASSFIDRAMQLARGCGCLSMRADTAADNQAMLAIFARKGFVCCGKINYAEASRGERLAFELML